MFVIEKDYRQGWTPVISKATLGEAREEFLRRLNEEPEWNFRLLVVLEQSGEWRSDRTVEHSAAGSER